MFILIVSLSYALAKKSMKDFTETPIGDNALYLIRNKHKFSEALQTILQQMQNSSLSISFERLFKGKKSALVVFGPKKLLEKLVPILDLIELEDYTDVDKGQVTAWEVKALEKPKSLPELDENEHFWWQLILWGNLNAQSRCILVSNNADKKKALDQILPRLPKAFSNEQMLDFYKKRSFQSVFESKYSLPQLLEFLLHPQAKL